MSGQTGRGDNSPATWICVGLFAAAMGGVLVAFGDSADTGVIVVVGSILGALAVIPILVGTIALGVRVGFAGSDH